MAGSLIKEYLVGLGFEVNDSSFKKFNSSVKTGELSVVALSAATIAAAASIAAFVTKMARQIAVMQNAALTTRSTAGEIDKLGFIAKQKGADIGAVTSSLESLNKAAGMAKLGLGDVQMTFRMLGVTVTDANGKLKSSAKLFYEVRDAMKGMGMEQQRLIMSRLGIDDSLWRTMAEDISVASDEYRKIREASGVNLDQAGKNALDYISA